jgi:hypothetical protein
MMNYNEYYVNSFVLTNMVQSMAFRESAFLSFDDTPSVRNVVVRDVSELLKNMKAFHFFSRKYNIYSSVARFDFAQLRKDHIFPPFSFYPKIRKNQRQIFNEHAKDYIIAYDFVLDFDVVDDFQTTYNEVKLMKNQYDLRHIPYILKFTGKGFHIIVPDKYLPVRKDKPGFCKALATSFKEIYDLSSLDLNIYDARRVVKTPYSLDIKTNLVCLPLSDSEFNDFSKDMCEPQNVLASNIFLRNSLLRDGYVDAFRKYVKELEVDYDEFDRFND